MLESLITSKTRVKLLMKLFLNAENKSHLRGMKKDFDESTNAVRLELNRFIDAGLLTDEFEKNRRYYRANRQHPLFNEIQSILQKMVGIDKIIESVASRIGNLEIAYLTGSFAEGNDSDTVELVLVGNNLDDAYIKELVAKAEKLIDRKIIYLVLTKEQMTHFFRDKPALLIWEKDEKKSRQ